MAEWDTARLVAADKRHVWHPFTDVREWCAPEHEPLVLVGGKGALLRDSNGSEYIDGNSSIWTNIHGHNHPHINEAIRRQLERVSHTSFLGFTNSPAIELAEAIIQLFPADTLTRVFYSDDGSTGVEVALRIASQYWHLKGEGRDRFVSFANAYHGDTAGAATMGAAALFQLKPWRWDFPALQVGSVAELTALDSSDAGRVAGIIIEPLIQGAAGMKMWPERTLSAVREWCNSSGALLIADEVMTGFGRTGRMFACEHQNVTPDLMIIGKGLTGGYLPLAITLLTEEIFHAFSDAEKDKSALRYGHSYTGNALGCAAALASLELFRRDDVLATLQPKIERMTAGLAALRPMNAVADTRQCGFIGAIEIGGGADGLPAEVAARNICLAARRHGLLTRPIRDVVVLMPPFCITDEQLDRAFDAIRLGIEEVCGS